MISGIQAQQCFVIYLFVSKIDVFVSSFKWLRTFSKLLGGKMLFQIFCFFSKVSNLRFDASKISKCSKMFKQTSLKFYMLYQKFQKFQIFMFQNVSHEFQHLLQMWFTLNFFQVLHISNYFNAFQCSENKLEISQCLKGFKNFDQAMFQMWKTWSFGMLASQCLAEPCFKTFCVSQMWKTLKFWCVGFKKFSQVMFQNILYVSNVICFGIIMCEMNVKVSKCLENKIEIS